MSEQTLEIRGIDTLLFRDGKPFDMSPGGTARSLPVPFPSTIAGLLRTVAGRAADGDFDTARQIRVAGPLLVYRRSESGPEVLYRAPADALAIPPAERGTPRIVRLAQEPFRDNEGCDLPGGMLPVLHHDPDKPASGYDWWPAPAMMRWLQGLSPGEIPAGIGPPDDERVHIQRDADTGISAEGKLFTTRMTAFERHVGLHPQSLHGVLERWSYLCRVSNGMEIPLGAALPGGEQRCGVIERAEAAWPLCPDALRTALDSAVPGSRLRVRMVLATPAIFTGGWIPGWLDKTSKTGSPDVAGVTLKLVAAAVPKRQAVSGWEQAGNRPKPVRYTAPAGSVYFFDVVAGSGAALAERAWLAPVSDPEEGREPGTLLENNASDGFGLALWGVWDKEAAN